MSTDVFITGCGRFLPGAPISNDAMEDHLGRIMQSSYVNFYLPNGGVVMPAFDDANDEKAREVIAACFPGRDILQIDALDIVEGGGGIHCITQQEPASP